jgi:ABC-type Na+ efflux pump permease subunit
VTATVVFQALVRKQLKQLRRSKRAMVTAVMMPALFLLYFPLTQHFFMTPHGATSAVLLVSVDPPTVTAQPGDTRVTVCAVVTNAATGEDQAEERVRFRVDAAPPEVTTDQQGRACSSLAVPGTPGFYPVVPALVGNAPQQVHPGYILVRDPAAVQGAGPIAPQPIVVSPPRPPTPALSQAQGVGTFDSPTQLFRNGLFPFFLFLAALMTPMSFAMQTVLTERDRRTLELLTALPVTSGEILGAKLITTVAVAAAVMLPLVAIDTVVIGVDGLGGAGVLVLDVLMLVTALAASTGSTLLIALLVREFRTTNNLAGFLALPVMAVFGGILFVVPSPWNLVLATGLLLVAVALTFVAAIKWLTLERYLE